MLSIKQMFVTVTIVTTMVILLFQQLGDRLHSHSNVLPLDPLQVDTSKRSLLTNVSETIGDGSGSNPVEAMIIQQCLPSLYVFCGEETPGLVLQTNPGSGLQAYPGLGKKNKYFKISPVAIDVNSSSSEGVMARFNASTNCTGSRVCWNTTRDIHSSLGRIWTKVTSGSPIIINVINTPAWLRNDMTAAMLLSRDCVFREGAVTETTDVVLAMGVHLLNRSKPRKRWGGQIYVLYGIEAPVHYKGILSSENSAWRRSFNMTATYLSTSDVFWPYGKLKFEPIPISMKPNYADVARSRTKMVVWLVSHCYTHSKREKYVRKMQKYIPIDIYGRCGKTPSCSHGNGTGCSTADILSEYKFYLAFENTFCADYVTEKFFKSYGDASHVIPVVRGGAKYDELLPNNTFVNADWFTGPRELALYLKALASDPVAHGRILELKDQYRALPRSNVFRGVCEAVTSLDVDLKTYDIKEWMDDQCAVGPRKIV